MKVIFKKTKGEFIKNKPYKIEELSNEDIKIRGEDGFIYRVPFNDVEFYAPPSEEKKYIFTGTVEDLEICYFRHNFEYLYYRGGGMSWAHYVNLETKEVGFIYVDSEKYEKMGGLEIFIEDLIKLGIVEEV